MTSSKGQNKLAVVIWAVLLGALGGSLELVVFWLKCRYFDPRNYNVSRHFPWMFPVAGVFIVGMLGLVLIVIETFRPGVLRSRWTMSILSFPACLGVLFRLPIATAACLILAAGVSYRFGACFKERKSLPGLNLKMLNVLYAWKFKQFSRSCLILSAVIVLLISASPLDRSETVAPATNSTSSSLKNVLLIVLDTVRADRLSRLGDPDGMTPNLARFAERGARFKHAYSAAPWTAPSHATMFTGRWPHEVGIGWNEPLDTGSLTLAEALASRGFNTAGFVANTTYCSYETGLDRGFARYEDYDVNFGSLLLCSSITQRVLNFLHQHPRIEARLPSLNFASSTRKDASRIRNDFLQWQADQGDRRFFAFLNFYDAHHPYLDPEADPSALPEGDRRLLKTWWDADKHDLSSKQIAMASKAYDDCIRYLDRQVGELLDDLDRKGVLKETLVIITADHGEHLGERNLYGHGCSLYGSELHVPLIVVGEGVVPAGRLIQEPATLRDLPATVVDLLDLPGKAPFPGKSLAPSRSDQPDEPGSPVVSEIQSPPEADPNGGKSPVLRGPMRSVVHDRMHYIRNGDGIEELYTIETDPDEQSNLADDPNFMSTLQEFRRRVGDVSPP